MDLGNTRTLTKEETAELYAVREATLPQLVILAEKCGLKSQIEYNSNGEGHVMLDAIPTVWNPLEILGQNNLLLSAVIIEGDCRLFYDHEIEEFFIYRYTSGKHDGPPLGHHTILPDTVFAAALELWFPYDE